MNLASIVVLGDVAGAPKVKLDLPSPLRLGDRLQLHFRIKRSNGNRVELLEVDGEFRVSSLRFEAGTNRQHLDVEAIGKAPAWRALKRTQEFKRVIPPARFPPRTIT